MTIISKSYWTKSISIMNWSQNFTMFSLCTRIIRWAKRDAVRFADLDQYIEIAHADPYVPLCLWQKHERQNYRTMRNVVSIFSTAPANLICFLKIRKHICGYLPSPQNCCAGIHWFSENAQTISAATKMFWSIVITIGCPHLTAVSSQRYAKPNGDICPNLHLRAITSCRPHTLTQSGYIKIIILIYHFYHSQRQWSMLKY